MFSFSRTTTSCKELFLVLLFGYNFALYTMSSVSLVDKGCSEEFQRVSVQISGTEIECGKKYSLSLVGNDEQPTFRFPAAEEESKYVLTMIDPDAPSPANPKYRSWLHFMAINVQGNNLKSGNIPGNGMIVMEYIPPSPPKGSGFHRYITLVLKQSAQLQGISIETRKSFDIDQFVANHTLEAVGSNMFKTETK